MWPSIFTDTFTQGWNRKEIGQIETIISRINNREQHVPVGLTFAQRLDTG